MTSNIVQSAVKLALACAITLAMLVKISIDSVSKALGASKICKFRTT